METVHATALSGVRADHERLTLVDEFLPVFDVSDTVATLVGADTATTWTALMEVDLRDVGRRRPIIAVLGALRAFPEVVAHLVRGESLPAAPRRMGLRDATALVLGEGGWVLLGERPGDEIALGLVGKFWRPVIDFAKVPPDRFRDFAEPGLRENDLLAVGRAIDPRRTLLSGVIRTATTVPPVVDVWRRFRRTRARTRRRRHRA